MSPTPRPLVLSLPGNERLAASLASALQADADQVALHRFPDQEISVRVSGDVAGRDVVLACTLDRPNDKLIALYLSAQTLRALGARRLLLVAPYLPYMRQDIAFHPGEGVSAAHIAHWLSGFLDGLVTVDPHLHRIQRLEQVYRIPTRVVHAAPLLADWVRRQIPNPLLVGPDAESRQWVASVAAAVPCPYIVLAKQRQGDREVAIDGPDLGVAAERTPVLIDDVISTGHTLVAASALLRHAGLRPPHCAVVHALLVDDALQRLHDAGIQALVSGNSVGHPSNAIDLDPALAEATAALLAAA